MATSVAAIGPTHVATNATAALPSTPAPVSNSLRFLRHVEGVEFNGTSENWDARPCFVVLVRVRDTEISTNTRRPFSSVERPTQPFQIERTAKELKALQAAMLTWCSKHKGEACGFCAAIASGETVVTAKKQANEDARPSSGCLSTILMGSATAKLSTENEWEAWLNATIEWIRGVDITGLAACEGVQHVPTLLAKFLLDAFASDYIL